MLKKSIVTLAALIAFAGFPACGSSDSNETTSGTGGSSSGTGGASGSSGASADAAVEASEACLPTIAWYADTSTTGSATDPGGKLPNAYGLYDMLGNAVEWVQDCYHETYAGAPTDGAAWEEATCEYRVIRGGCYGSTARGVRVSWRDGVKTSFYGSCLPGIRCVRTSTTVPPTALISMDWAKIPAGSFTMGCSAGDSDCYANESSPHVVQVQAFEMTTKEPTQQQYYDQVGSSPAAQYCPTCAETYVSWEEAQAFCQALGGRLPTEAEWEYAARGGTTTRYYCGDN